MAPNEPSSTCDTHGPGPRHSLSAPEEPLFYTEPCCLHKSGRCDPHDPITVAFSLTLCLWDLKLSSWKQQEGMQLAHALRERTVAKLLGEGVCCRRHRRGIIQQQVARLSTSEIFEKRGPRAMSPVKSCTIGKTFWIPSAAVGHGRRRLARWQGHCSARQIDCTACAQQAAQHRRHSNRIPCVHVPTFPPSLNQLHVRRLSPHR